MNKSVVFRMAFALVSIGLMVFVQGMNLPAIAQDKDSCSDSGWTPIDAEIDLKGVWTGAQNRNCKESAAWQYAGFKVTISEEGGILYGKVGSEEKSKIEINGSKFVWTRDLRKGAGEEKPGLYSQTWRGSIQRNKEGSIRIYGAWSGAYQSRKKDDYNLDFMLVK